MKESHGMQQTGTLWQQRSSFHGQVNTKGHSRVLARSSECEAIAPISHHGTLNLHMYVLYVKFC